MKGCLKRIPVASNGNAALLSPRKTVAFEAQSLEQVYLADEWDRTPMEPSKKLSYQDILELKQIQLSLPRANQPADNLSGRSGSHYLSGVPIGLLPLLPETSSTLAPPSPSSRPTSSPMSPSWASFSPNSHQCPMPSSPPLGGVDAMLQPSHRSQPPPARTTPDPKPKSRFAFLPLLDPSNPSRSRSPSPDPSDTDPPTPSLTNASLESSPLSRASSCSPEPPFFQLPPPRKRPGPYGPTLGDEQASDTEYPVISSALGNMKLGSSKPPYGYARPPLTRFVPPPPPPPPVQTTKKRNVIYVNGMEIDLDDDDGNDDECSTPPASSPRSFYNPSKAPSIPTSSPPRAGLPSFAQPSSPTLRWQSSPSQSTGESPFSGLHAPVRFKRQSPSVKGDCSSPISTSPPSPRRGSVCSTKINRPHVGTPRSPVLMPRA